MRIKSPCMIALAAAAISLTGCGKSGSPEYPIDPLAGNAAIRHVITHPGETASCPPKGQTKAFTVTHEEIAVPFSRTPSVAGDKARDLITQLSDRITLGGCTLTKNGISIAVPKITAQPSA